MAICGTYAHRSLRWAFLYHYLKHTTLATLNSCRLKPASLVDQCGSSTSVISSEYEVTAAIPRRVSKTLTGPVVARDRVTPADCITYVARTRQNLGCILDVVRCAQLNTSVKVRRWSVHNSIDAILVEECILTNFPEDL